MQNEPNNGELLSFDKWENSEFASEVLQFKPNDTLWENVLEGFVTAFIERVKMGKT